MQQIPTKGAHEMSQFITKLYISPVDAGFLPYRSAPIDH